jgi:pimeloyl-ACP methyl ester carboxylesterase
MMGQIERLVLFPGTMMGAPARLPDVRGLERIAVAIPEGEVEAFFLPAFDVPRGERRPVVLFAHGNGEIIDEWAEVLEPYRAMGVGVLLPEYRGYGRSAGTPSEAAIVDDFCKFYDELLRRPDVDAARIVLHGRSLGGGAVCALARQRTAAGLVLESTFTSVADVARRWLVPRSMLSNRFDNDSAVREFAHPILILHGRHDRVIPYSHAEALARVARGAKLVTYDCDHNDMRRETGEFWSEIRAYLESVGVLSAR